jgi:hypothetical protein
MALNLFVTRVLTCSPTYNTLEVNNDLSYTAEPARKPTKCKDTHAAEASGVPPVPAYTSGGMIRALEPAGSSMGSFETSYCRDHARGVDASTTARRLSTLEKQRLRARADMQPVLRGKPLVPLSELRSQRHC